MGRGVVVPIRIGYIRVTTPLGESARVWQPIITGLDRTKGIRMALTQDDVRGIAAYACIALEGEELEQMTAYLNDAVAMVEPILRYTAEDVEPTFHANGGQANVMRADAVDDARALSLEAALANAASAREGQFRVPSILGGGE